MSADSEKIETTQKEKQKLASKLRHFARRLDIPLVGSDLKEIEGLIDGVENLELKFEELSLVLGDNQDTWDKSSDERRNQDVSRRNQELRASRSTPALYFVEKIIEEELKKSIQSLLRGEFVDPEDFARRVVSLVSSRVSSDTIKKIKENIQPVIDQLLKDWCWCPRGNKDEIKQGIFEFLESLQGEKET